MGERSTTQARVLRQATAMVGVAAAEDLWAELSPRLEDFRRRRPELSAAGSRPDGGLGLDQRDVLLIAYGDQVTSSGEPPLVTLKRFLDERLRGLVTGLHLLPHYPWSSDDGFSVVDYRAVDPTLGTWADVERLAADYRVMFDAVINHVSARSPWFQAFLRGEAPYDGYFLALPPDTDLSQVYRPREHPLLTPFETETGTRHVWTTFSEDQVDLRFDDPRLVLEVLDVLLDYVGHGARLLRLDAIGLLYKKLGTPCLHLEETHAFVKLVRAVLDAVAPGVLLVPEVNGPYEENAPYFGDGVDEAQLVYNFTLPPLVLNAFQTGDARTLGRWLESVRLPGDRTTFFNFLASHDGIGVRPADGLLSPDEIDRLVHRVEQGGARVNHRSGPGGARVPYELCTTWYDALCGPEETLEVGVARHRASHAVMLCLAGVPGLYFHSLFGTPSWHEGYERTKHNRTLNRRKLELGELEVLLADPGGRAACTFEAMAHLIRVRSGRSAFRPTAPQRVLDLHPSVLAIERGEGDAPGERVLCLTNVGGDAVRLALPEPAPGGLVDALDGRRLTGAATLEPYGVRWLERPSG